MLSDLREKHKWPAECPDVEENLTGWMTPKNKKMFTEVIERDNPKIVLELGSWLGLSTRFLCDHVDCVISVDHWEGSGPWMRKLPVFPVLYETFLKNCWKYRNKLIPIRTTTIKGVLEVYEAGVVPDLVYVDAAHDTASVIEDLEICMTLFPKATIVGDDWQFLTVKEGVFEILRRYQYDIRTTWRCFELTR